jgi:hypothetical protein
MPNRLLAALVWFVAGNMACLQAEPPFRYREQKHGMGELKYINGVPVLTVAGTPEEIGTQVTELAVKPAGRALNYPKDFLKQFGAGWSWRFFVSQGESLLPNFPLDHRKEMDVMARAGVDPEVLLAANTMFDIRKFIGCSALIAEASRSETGHPLFGRNLDFSTAGYLHGYSLVTVYRPQGKHAFASVTFPGLVGCLSGMNDAGLALAILEIHLAGDGSAKFDKQGTPYALCYRRLLEECTTVEEAEKLLRSMKRTTRTNLAICDRNGGAVFEITPKQVVVRRAVNGMCLSTNHYTSKELAPLVELNLFRTRDRYRALEKRAELVEKFDVPTIGKALDAANMDDWTLQTMVFEPAALRLHVALGKCPSSALPLKVLDLGPLFLGGQKAAGP